MNTQTRTSDKEQKRRYWRHHLKAWQKSGMNQSAYCRAHGLKPYQMSYWKSRLAESEQRISFVPLQLPSNLPVPVNQTALKLHTPNGFVIDVAGNFDPHVLRQLIATIKAL